MAGKAGGRGASLWNCVCRHRKVSSDGAADCGSFLRLCRLCNGIGNAVRRSGPGSARNFLYQYRVANTAVVCGCRLSAVDCSISGKSRPCCLQRASSCGYLLWRAKSISDSPVRYRKRSEGSSDGTPCFSSVIGTFDGTLAGKAW